MKNLFNYENKFMQILMTLGDLIILNILFILCCVPIFTIGAAQAGLYTGLRVLMDKEDDSSPAAAFFRGFSSGFGRITCAYLIMLVLIVLVGYTAGSVAFFDVNGVDAPVWASIVGLCICALFQTLICIFHSRFQCTVWQLFRNAWLVFLAHPLRCILITALTWSGVVIAFVDLGIFILITPMLLTLFFSFTFLLSNSIMKKPFDDLIRMFNEKNSPEQPTESAETEEAAEDMDE